ncbi:hypothetical protein CTRI78_v003048 [Colletotrichum trifolii]|uniref:Uncharacterized protein n=1 Tax=Colletotrichum trifolii TaxID=5466 RepID=A0A4R8RNT1_COLTR|nr:hypothetical protein CTRI78_v003048 [Colletotrichum trifolii]
MWDAIEKFAALRKRNAETRLDSWESWTGIGQGVDVELGNLTPPQDDDPPPVLLLPQLPPLQPSSPMSSIHLDRHQD